MTRNRSDGLRVDITVRDPLSGKIYQQRDAELVRGVQEMFTYIADKYNRDMQPTDTDTEEIQV